jgi:hypothetical protein
MRWLVICGALAASPAYAQEADGVAAASGDSANDVDYSIPSGPAFSFLGTTPTQISQPGSIKDLGVELATGFDDNGKLKAGLAIAVAPASLVDGLGALRGLELSLGTARGSTEASAMDTRGPTDAAIGARWTVIDQGDAWKRHDFRAETMQLILDKCAPPGPAPDNADAAALAARRDALVACSKKYIAQQRTKFEDANWNAFRLELAAAVGWRLPESNPIATETFTLGHAYWGLASGNIPGFLDKNLQWTVLAELDQRHEAEGSALTEQLKGGARVFLGWNRFHAYAELVWKYRWIPEGMPGPDERDTDWGVGAEVRITDKQWLVVGVGNALDNESDIQVFGNVKWAITDSERFARPSRN